VRIGSSLSRSVVGLDIQPGYVAAVETRSGQVAVERSATAPLAPGVVRDGEVVDVDTLAAVLKELFAQNKPVKRVRPDGWRGVQAREQVIKSAVYGVLQDVDEVERIFLIIKQQREY